MAAKLCPAIFKELAGQKWPASPALATPDLHRQKLDLIFLNEVEKNCENNFRKEACQSIDQFT
jgi:hypothetical protein